MFANGGGSNKSDPGMIDTEKYLKMPNDFYGQAKQIALKSQPVPSYPLFLLQFVMEGTRADTVYITFLRAFLIYRIHKVLFNFASMAL